MLNCTLQTLCRNTYCMEATVTAITPEQQLTSEYWNTSWVTGTSLTTETLLLTEQSCPLVPSCVAGFYMAYWEANAHSCAVKLTSVLPSQKAMTEMLALIQTYRVIHKTLQCCIAYSTGENYVGCSWICLNRRWNLRKIREVNRNKNPQSILLELWKLSQQERRCYSSLRLQ